MESLSKFQNPNFKKLRFQTYFWKTDESFQNYSPRFTLFRLPAPHAPPKNKVIVTFPIVSIAFTHQLTA
jgi:hypothetical protein